ncbi:hypothetical protein RvY_13965 [Ramazzottius varieornatus]|uniref:Golgi SNAP receptor complex member 2 n=1 Tax=Ramazzottius varieornatus TaxID=947166 RepID=A0A1D1VRT8_RAMVA|nr:hypothetical protein RvY_13965 [Ramazzottius varieornatus]
MTSTLERLCMESDALLRDVESNLVKYNQVDDQSTADVDSSVERMVGALTANVERMDILLDKEPSMRRQVSKHRVDQIKYNFHMLKSSISSLKSQRSRKLQEEKEREELLRTDFTSLSRDAHTAIKMHDADARYQSSLRNVNRSVDNIMDTGREVLNNLRIQRSTLSSARSRMLDIGQKLGLSTSLMKMIERRSLQDQYFLYAGIVITLLLMFAMYWYFA